VFTNRPNLPPYSTLPSTRAATAGEILRNVRPSVTQGALSEVKDFARELMAACKNAIRLSSDPQLPYRIGTSIHISAYGMYGFAILCCPDFRKRWLLAELYHRPRGRRWQQFKFTEEERFASWVIEPDARAAADPQSTASSREQIGHFIYPLMRDIMGAAFTSGIR